MSYNLPSARPPRSWLRSVCCGPCHFGAVCACPANRLSLCCSPPGAAGGRLLLPNARQVHVDSHWAGRTATLRLLRVHLCLAGCCIVASRATLACHLAASFI